MTTSAKLTRHHSGSLERLVHEKPIALRLERRELEEVKAIAEAEGRSYSNLSRLLLLMGKADYKRKGRLELPTSQEQEQAAA